MDDGSDAARGSTAAALSDGTMYPTGPGQARVLARALESRREEINDALCACAASMLAEMALRYPFVGKLSISFNEDRERNDLSMMVAGKSGSCHCAVGMIGALGEWSEQKSRLALDGSPAPQSEHPSARARREDCGGVALADLREAYAIFWEAREIFRGVDKRAPHFATWIRSEHGEPTAKGLARVFGLDEVAVKIEAAEIEGSASASSRRAKPRSI